MLSLIKIDLYKLFRSKAFYITGIIAAFFAAAIAFTSTSGYLAGYEFYLKDIESLKENPQFAFGYEPKMQSSSIFYILLQSLPILYLLISIFIILFFCSEFSNGTMKNIASKGYSRVSIYLSKLFAGVVTTVIYFTVTTCIILGIASYKAGDKIPHFYDLPSSFFTNFGFAFLATLACMAIALFLASLIRGGGGAIGAFFGLYFFEGLILPSIDDYLGTLIENKAFSLMQYSPQGVMQEITYQYVSSVVNIPGATKLLASADITSSVIIRWCSFIAVCLIGLTALGIYLFKKRDI